MPDRPGDSFDVRPVTLGCNGVELRAADLADAEELAAVCPREDLTWSPSWWGAEDVDGVRRILERFVDDPAIVPFVIRFEGVPCGFTTYLDIRPAHRGLEIGHTWIGRHWQRTSVNPAVKLLLLRHAFERLGAVRVCLKTDARNLRSQAAIEKLGAKREGVLRAHLRLPDGFRRDTVYYSILDDEWPRVREGLERRLAATPRPE